MRIKEIMNKAIAVDHDISLKEAAKIMSKNNIGSLVVLKKGEIFGIVTEKDLIKDFSDSSKKISSVMSKKVLTIGEDEDIDNAVEIMAKNKIKRIPVVDDDENLSGIVTTTDILAHADEINEDFFFD